MTKGLFLKSAIKYLVGMVAAVLALLASQERCAGQTYTNVAPQKGVNSQSTNANWGGGVGFFDYDNDGEDDLTYADSLDFYTNDTGALTKNSFVNQLGVPGHALWLDFDNDGDNDLFVTYRYRQNVLYENTGGLTFRKMTNNEIDLSDVNHTFGASACDFNKDGYLDIYVANYEQPANPNKRKKDTSTFNKLYRNNGDGTFTEVGVKAGVDDGTRTSFQGIWIDYNDDGWQDLYVINDLLPANSLYRNEQNGTFTEVTTKKNVGMPNHHPMSGTAGDMDNDGALDIYMSNTYINNNTRDGIFLKNDGSGNYTEKARQYGINIKKWSWGCSWVDYDNDSYQDLYITTARLDQPPLPLYKNRFYENDKGSSFTSKQSAFVDSHQSRSFAVAKGDLTGNGYYDLYVQGNMPEEVQLWKNSGASNHYIKTTVEGTSSNRMGIGSWIHVYVDTHSYHKYTKCGGNYSGQNSQHKIFGLDTATKVDSVVVEYLSGFKDKYINLAVDTHYYFKEGETRSVKVAGKRALCHKNDSSKLTVLGTYDSLQWNNNDKGATITVSQPGQYWVKGITPKGVWVQSDTIRVQSYPQIKTQVSRVKCHGESGGSIQLSLDTIASQLNPSFQWAGANKRTATRDSLRGGNYPYTYTDTTGCQLKDTIKVSEPAPLNTQTNVTFKQGKADSAARLSAVINGGTPPYRESLNGNAITTPVKSLPTGNYQYQVTDSNGCTNTKPITITRAAVPPIKEKVQPITCYDASDGAIQLVIDSLQGRQARIRWKDGPRGPKRSGLPAGQYVYRYNDDQGAQYVDSVQVKRPDSLSLNPITTPQTLTGLGRIKVTPSGGTAPYQVIIDGQAVDSVLGKLQAGDYTVTVKDSQGCSTTRTLTVKDQRVPEINADKTPVSCHGEADGAIELKIDSLYYRTRDFNINWQNTATGPERHNLPAGRYPFTYRDNKGITVRDTINLSAPAPLSYEQRAANNETGKCQVKVTITGGNEPYTIQWDSSYRSNPVTPDSKGTYHLKVTDRKSCSLDTTVTLKGVAEPEMQVERRPASCADSEDGMIKLQPRNLPDTSIEIRWHNGRKGKKRDSVAAGLYHYQILTDEGCRFSDSLKVEAPYALSTQYRVVKKEGNPNAGIELVINGGTPPYRTYLDSSRRTRPIDSVTSGDHNLKVVDDQGCTESHQLKVPGNDNASTIGSTASGQEPEVYPTVVQPGQPVSIQSGSEVPIKGRLTISTSQGRLMQAVDMGRNGDTHEISTAGWSAGVYLVRWQSAENFFIQKVIVR